jgi:hypothetical protein
MVKLPNKLSQLESIHLFLLILNLHLGQYYFKNMTIEPETERLKISIIILHCMTAQSHSLHQVLVCTIISLTHTQHTLTKMNALVSQFFYPQILVKYLTF